MDAIVVTRDDRQPRVADRPKPEPDPGEALVRTLRVGVDGTDHEVVAGDHGGFPEDSAEFVRGEPDMAAPGDYVERGIDGADGFMAEYFTSPADSLVPVPDDLAELGFLVEPISITEKALDLAFASRSTFAWH